MQIGERIFRQMKQKNAGNAGCINEFLCKICREMIRQDARIDLSSVYSRGDNMTNNGYEKYHTHITAEKKRFDFNLPEVWRYRDLIILFTKRSFKLIYKQTVLGPAWILLNPILSSLMYTIVFGRIAGMSSDGVPQLLFYLSGTAIWTMFSTTLVKNAATFTANAAVFGKVYFPRLTMPLSIVLSSIIQFFMQFILVLILLVFYMIKGSVHPSPLAFVMIPLILVQLGLMGLGFGIIISSLTTKYRDLQMLVNLGVSLWMYITPVVYPMSQITNDLLKIAVKINPVSMPVELFRYYLLGVGEPDFLFYGISWAVTFVVLFIGISIFNKVEKTFVDTV